MRDFSETAAGRNLRGLGAQHLLIQLARVIELFLPGEHLRQRDTDILILGMTG